MPKKDGKKKPDALSIYREAVDKAYEDGIVTEDEKGVLKDLGKRLKLTKSEMQIIVNDAKKNYMEAQEKEQVQAKGKKPMLSLPPTSDDEMELRTLRIEREALDKEVDLLQSDDEELVKKMKDLTAENATLKKEKKGLEMKVKALEELNKELTDRLEKEEEMYQKEIEEEADIEDHGVDVAGEDMGQTPEVEDEKGEPLAEEEETAEGEPEEEEAPEEAQEEEPEEEEPPAPEPQDDFSEPEDVPDADPEEVTAVKAEEEQDKIDDLFSDIPKDDTKVMVDKSKALPEQSTTESVVGSLHDELEGASGQKHVACPNCSADILVELIPGKPTIFTCTECGQKSYI